MGQAAKEFKDLQFVMEKECIESMQNLHKRGGKWQKKANIVKTVHSDITIWNSSTDKEKHPLHGLKETNHGESRIDSCIKYDLGDGIRLITIQDNGVCAFMFTGDHNQCDLWLNRNKGIKLSRDKQNTLKKVFVSNVNKEPKQKIYSVSDLSEGKLWTKLPERYIHVLFKGLISLVANGLKNLESTFQDDDLEELCEAIAQTDQHVSEAILDVFLLLRNGNVKQAKNRIDLLKNEQMLVAESNIKDGEKLKAGEDFISLNVIDSEELEHLLKTSGFKEWMLFLHPEQEKIVTDDHNGPAKLAGVSGSGKTAIIVQRAIRLAKKYAPQKILVVTLNKALATLISELVSTACTDVKVRECIEIKSFWKLCKDELNAFERDVEKRFVEITWKQNETVDEIWDEYYFCENNNQDAEKFYAVHKSLLSRNVNARTYIKQEFDWIRSAFPLEERKSAYLSVNREGRSEPLSADFRNQLLEGLIGWEQKMQAIGVIDYTGLAAKLHPYKDQLQKKYRSILVDELQDFGTLELSILRALVPEGENDMFLCGDIAQQVHTKHHKITQAGIEIRGRSYKIKQNYRNSREILRSAYELLHNNVVIDEIKTDDFEILEPEYANFSTAKPVLIRASSLEQEIRYAMCFINAEKEEDKKACIAIAGLSLHQIKKIGVNLDCPVLDSFTNIDQSDIFLSDLDQTKGFEFDMMFVLNCTDEVVPNTMLPQPEWFRDICKLYVAMTRAKNMLFVSYHGKYSRLFHGIEDNFVMDEWNNQVHLDANYKHLKIEKQHRFIFKSKQEYLRLTGREYLYTDFGIGLPIEVQNKLLDLVTGINSSLIGKTTQWPDVASLFRDKDIPNVSRRMGPTAYKTLKNHIDQRH